MYLCMCVLTFCMCACNGVGVGCWFQYLWLQDIAAVGFCCMHIRRINFVCLFQWLIVMALQLMHSRQFTVPFLIRYLTMKVLTLITECSGKKDAVIKNIMLNILVLFHFQPTPIHLEVVPTLASCQQSQYSSFPQARGGNLSLSVIKLCTSMSSPQVWSYFGLHVLPPFRQVYFS